MSNFIEYFIALGIKHDNKMNCKQKKYIYKKYVRQDSCVIYLRSEKQYIVQLLQLLSAVL